MRRAPQRPPRTFEVGCFLDSTARIDCHAERRVAGIPETVAVIRELERAAARAAQVVLLVDVTVTSIRYVQVAAASIEVHEERVARLRDRATRREGRMVDVCCRAELVVDEEVLSHIERIAAREAKAADLGHAMASGAEELVACAD